MEQIRAESRPSGAAERGIYMTYAVRLDKESNPVAIVVDGNEVQSLRGMSREESLQAFMTWCKEHQIKFFRTAPVERQKYKRGDIKMSTTKQQERAALEKIRKIVADLGELSYIGTAMLGVWEIAEENIEYDFGVSAREKWEHAASEASELRGKVRELEQDLGETSKIANEQIDRAERLREDLDRERECSTAYKQERDDAQDEAKSLAADLERSGFQIMELKAKLYDRIVGMA